MAYTHSGPISKVHQGQPLPASGCGCHSDRQPSHRLPHAEGLCSLGARSEVTLHIIRNGQLTNIFHCWILVYVHSHTKACLSSLCPSVCLSVCLSVSVCLAACLAGWLSVCLSVCLSVGLSACLFVCVVSVCVSVCLSVCLTVAVCR